MVLPYKVKFQKGDNNYIKETGNIAWHSKWNRTVFVRLGHGHGGHDTDFMRINSLGLMNIGLANAIPSEDSLTHAGKGPGLPVHWA